MIKPESIKDEKTSYDKLLNCWGKSHVLVIFHKYIVEWASDPLCYNSTDLKPNCDCLTHEQGEVTLFRAGASEDHPLPHVWLLAGGQSSQVPKPSHLASGQRDQNCITRVGWLPSRAQVAAIDFA